MIRTLVILLALAWGAPGVVQAQVAATLRAGEHDGFTRLAFRAPDRVEWTVTRIPDDRVRLDFSPASFRIDAPDVFSRIRRDRVRSVAAEDTSVILSLGCDCSVLVQQLATGFVAIDIADSPGSRPKSVRLPLQFEEIPMQGFDFAFAEPIETNGKAATRSGKPTDNDANADLPPQVAVRSANTPRAAPGRDVSAPCMIEARAADILSRDPVDALDDVIKSRGAIAGAADRLNVAAVMATADAFLAAGFGAEADGLLEGAGRELNFIDRRIARALDGRGNDELAAFTDCGPATKTLHMLSMQDEPRATIDLDLIRFLDALPAARRRMLLPRLDFLQQDELGQSYVASELRGPEADPRIAGTNAAAVEAVIMTLDLDWNPESDQAEAHLENGLALRRSVPGGQARDRLDKALLRRLIETGHAANGVELLSDRPDLATLAIDHALATLGEPAAIEALTRFAPNLPQDAVPHREAAALMRRYGLERSARLFSSLDERPVVSLPTRADALDPWLRRDFSAMVEGSDTPRAALAEELQRRNSETPATGDFARAQRAVTDASRIVAAIDPVLRAQEVEADPVTRP